MGATVFLRVQARPACIKLGLAAAKVGLQNRGRPPVFLRRRLFNGGRVWPAPRQAVGFAVGPA